MRTIDSAAQPSAPQVKLFAEEEVLSIEDLARQFNVSTKTISRWRDHGLVAQRFTVDGRRRVGFLKSAVERFIHDNPLRIERGSRFSQLSGEEHDKIISWAKRLAARRCLPGRRASADRRPAGPERRDRPLHDQAVRPRPPRRRRLSGGRWPAAA